MGKAALREEKKKKKKKEEEEEEEEEEGILFGEPNDVQNNGSHERRSEWTGNARPRNYTAVLKKAAFVEPLLKR
ncbi:hypothetical protein T01_14506 [Trichinella spiralis]|uniref:Uncharacterized protein n=1 Tax=Trichinella spiralis TaxID=6334 RepID=A0A0V1BTI2_TRISP|nr:hypothetical protein T01_14506 [Trichinella spiralis]